MISLSKSIRKNPHWAFFFFSQSKHRGKLTAIGHLWLSFPQCYQESLVELHGPMFQKILCANFSNKAKFKQKSTPSTLPHPHIFFSSKRRGAWATPEHITFLSLKQITRFQNILAKNKLSCVSFRDGNCFWLLTQPYFSAKLWALFLIFMEAGL